VNILRWFIAGAVTGLLKIATGFLFHGAVFGAAYDDPTRLAVWRAYPAQMTHMALLSVAAGLLLALSFWFVRRTLPGPPALKGLLFGSILWAGSALALTLSFILWVNMPAAAAWAWLLDSLVWLPLAGTLIGLIFGKSTAR
jgi:hypothetical protein